ncbi:hypothetical protein ACN6Q1_02365, partial [Acinetobacter baumannii]
QHANPDHVGSLVGSEMCIRDRSKTVLCCDQSDALISDRAVFCLIECWFCKCRNFATLGQSN